jgi:hypothetical protein
VCPARSDVGHLLDADPGVAPLCGSRGARGHPRWVRWPDLDRPPRNPYPRSGRGGASRPGGIRCCVMHSGYLRRWAGRAESLE